jgi:hypothetical protein
LSDLERNDERYTRWLEMQRGTLVIVGADRLIRDDMSASRVRRRHIIRRGELPDPAWLAEVMKEHPDASNWFFMDTNEIGHLYIVWKE